MPGLSSRIEAARARVGARALSLGGFAVGLAAVPLIALGHFWIALGVLLAGRAIALLGDSDGGLDAVLFASLPFAFALADPSRAVAAAFLLFAFVASTATTRRLERIDGYVALAGFALACLLPERFGLIAYAMGVACFVVAGLRFAKVLA
ncbi:MAG TPA: hypothetical protein VG889_06015 [Rhizomicrobium sp.]|nr:hypothetical protein [Rhizomicrobium sp.]